METPDKNAHLSPLLSNIKDYGPGDVEADPDEPSPVPPADDPEAVLPESSHQPREEKPMTPQTAGDSGTRWIVYGLVSLWLLTLIAGFGAFVWQQTRLDALLAEREAERIAAQGRIVAAENEAAQLSERVADLEAGMAERPVTAMSAREPTVDVSRRAASPSSEQAPAKAASQPDEGATATVASAVPAPEPPTEPPPARDPAPAAAREAAPAATPVASGWFVNLSTFSTEAQAQGWLASLPGPPAAAGVSAVRSNGKQLYRVRIGGFGSREEARAAADRYVAEWRLKGAWVSDN